MKEKVNLLLLGTQKAGTTSLYKYLKQHPDICFSDLKEITYFVDDIFYKKGIKYFHAFFKKYNNQKIIASSYVHMLSSENAPKRVLNYNKNMKFIILLREPIARAFSAFNYARQNGWEKYNMDFLRTLELESERMHQKKIDLLYFYNGLYAKHISNWMNFFPKENFFIVTTKEFQNDPKNVMKKINFFLAIPNYKFVTKKKSNVTQKPRLIFINKFLLTRNKVIRAFFGKFLNSSLKNWLLRIFIPFLLKINQSSKKFKNIEENEKSIVANYFLNDLKILKQKYNIDFE